jgi:hypothetical protein
MCGCEKHHNKRANCTCICREHRNFERAYDLAMNRYDEIRALRAALEAAERERDEWRESAADLGRRLNKAEYDRDEEQYENQRLRDGLTALAERNIGTSGRALISLDELAALLDGA